MKRFAIVLTILFLGVKSFAQTPVISKDYYLKKSKTQKTVGWILLGTGAGIAAYGLITLNDYTDNANFGTANYTGALIAIGGGVIAASSIPFFISSAKNKRKAATISFTSQKILWYQKNNMCFL